MATRRGNWLPWFALGTVALGSALGLLLWRIGLDRADQLSSIVSMVVGVLSFLVACLSLFVAFRTFKQEAPRVSERGGRYIVTNINPGMVSHGNGNKFNVTL